MSDTAAPRPGPDSVPGPDPVVMFAAPSASAQLAGIRELLRIADLQTRAYAQARAAAMVPRQVDRSFGG